MAIILPENATVFPLGLSNKEDSPEKLALVVGIDSKYYELAVDLNKKKYAIEENRAAIVYIAKNTQSTILIDSVLFTWGKNRTNTTNTLAVGDVISNGRISQDAHIYSAIYKGGNINDFGTIENNFTDGSYKDVYFEDNGEELAITGQVTEESANVYQGDFLVQKGEPNEVITLQFDVVAPDDSGNTNVYLDSIENGVYLNYDTPFLTTTVNLNSNGYFGSPMTIENHLKLIITIVSRSSEQEEGIGKELIIDTNNI
ncbi:MAG: hypothetical protein ACSHXA_07460 [Polaribacter sp.]|uniref:hypothetical protein n=1 Tax=Polaribacter sp. TaxID=1920175 RepID=UPI003EFAA702